MKEIHYTKMSACNAETIAYLHHVWELMRDNALEKLQPDPFYERAPLFTEEIVNGVLRGIEAYMQRDFDGHVDFHHKAQGIASGIPLVAPRFSSLPYAKRLAIVLGLDRIQQSYLLTPEEEEKYAGYAQHNEYDEYNYD